MFSLYQAEPTGSPDYTWLKLWIVFTAVCSVASLAILIIPSIRAKNKSISWKRRRLLAHGIVAAVPFWVLWFTTDFLDRAQAGLKMISDWTWTVGDDLITIPVGTLVYLMSWYGAFAAVTTIVGRTYYRSEGDDFQSDTEEQHDRSPAT